MRIPVAICCVNADHVTMSSWPAVFGFVAAAIRCSREEEDSVCVFIDDLLDYGDRLVPSEGKRYDVDFPFCHRVADCLITVSDINGLGLQHMLTSLMPASILLIFG